MDLTPEQLRQIALEVADEFLGCRTSHRAHEFLIDYATRVVARVERAEKKEHESCSA